MAVSIVITDVSPSTTSVSFTVRGTVTSSPNIWQYRWILTNEDTGRTVAQSDPIEGTFGTGDTDTQRVTGLTRNTNYSLFVCIYDAANWDGTLDAWWDDDRETFSTTGSSYSEYDEYDEYSDSEYTWEIGSNKGSLTGTGSKTMNPSYGEVEYFTFTPPSNGKVTIESDFEEDVFGWIFKGKASIYDDTGSGENVLDGNVLGYDDEGAGNGQFLIKNVSVTANTKYYIYVHGYRPDTRVTSGTVYLTFTPSAANSTLNINLNGGTWSSSLGTSISRSSGQVVELPVPTKTGYVFKGWSRTNTYGSLSNAANSVTVESVSGASYGFELNSNGYYESTNQGVNNSAALIKVKFNLSSAQSVTFDCISYAESKYDYGIFSNLNTTLSTAYNSDVDGAASVYYSFRYENSSAVQQVSYDLPAGESYITIKFRKDGSSHDNNDSLQFKLPSLSSSGSSSSYSIVDLGATYKFVLNENGYYESNNKNVNNSFALTSIKFNLLSQSTVILDCINYGEPKYDYGIFSKSNHTLTADNSDDSKSSTTKANVQRAFKEIGDSRTDIQPVIYPDLSPGEHIIQIKFRKDGSAYGGNDSLQFKPYIASTMYYTFGTTGNVTDTLTAQWAPKQYAINYYNSSGTLQYTSYRYYNMSFKISSNVSLPPTGQTQIGWATSSTATTAQYVRDTSYTNLNTSTSTLSLYPVCKSLVIFRFENVDYVTNGLAQYLTNLTPSVGVPINLYASQDKIKDFINKINTYCKPTTNITFSESQTLANYNAIVEALNKSSAPNPSSFSGTIKPNLQTKTAQDFIIANDLIILENAFNKRYYYV